MNLVYEYGRVEAIPLYNCSGAPTFGQKRPFIGMFSILYGLFSITLFIPILKIMLSPDLIRLSCYKIMLFVGVIDVGAICMCSILTGWLASEGAVYCTYPELNYYFGAYGLGIWLCSCLANILLLLNRILNFKNPFLADAVYRGYKTYIFLTIPVIYGAYASIFTKTICFNSKYYAWFFDPFIFPEKGSEYSNILHSFNNIAVVIFTCFLYLYVGYLMVTKSKITILKSHTQRLFANSILYQSLVICAFDQISSVIYVVMNYMTLPAYTTIIGQYFWQSAHAFPVFAYLTLNLTIRGRFLGLIRRRLTRHVAVIPINSTRHIFVK